MLQRTADYINQQKMILPGEKIVIGLSGGMDSVCLFHVLKDLGYQLEAVHVNHGIRGKEADRDEAFAGNLCESYQIPFHCFRFDVPEICREWHLSEEEAGRDVRRRAFSKVMEEIGAAHVALAHHGNDRAETFLFHLIRGAGIRGLASMKPVEGVYIRPFLWAERREIENYVRKQGYAFVEDETNASFCYTRNKMRHQVLPLLEEINPRSTAHICAAAEKLSTAAAYMEKEAGKLLDVSVIFEEKRVRVLKEPFFQGEEVLQVPVLQKTVEYLTGTLANITKGHWEMLRGLFDMQTGKELHLPYGVTAVRTYEGICMFFREERKEAVSVEITGEGDYHFGGRTFLVSIEDWEEGKNFPINSYTKCFDYDKMKRNPFLRTRQSGDYLEINKDHGKKLLQDYLVNEKVPKEKRDEVILLGEGNHILWVVGKRISEYYKITKGTKRVLKVQVCRENEKEFYS